MKDSDYVETKSVNPLYLVISNVDGHFEEKNGTKYLILDSTNKNKEVLKSMQDSEMELKITLNAIPLKK